MWVNKFTRANLKRKHILKTKPNVILNICIEPDYIYRTKYMFNDPESLVAPRPLEYKLFDKKKSRKKDISVIGKNDEQKQQDFVISIREMLFPANYPFKVKGVKKINDIYEVFLSSPDKFSFTDDHFQLINHSLLAAEEEFEEIRSLLKSKDVKNFDDFMPIKTNNQNFYFEIFFYNLYYKNWIHLFKKLITQSVG